MVCFTINTNGDIGKDKVILDFDDGNQGYSIVGSDDEIKFSTDFAGTGAKSVTTITNFNGMGYNNLCGYVSSSVMKWYVNGVFDSQIVVAQTGGMNPTGINLTLGSTFGGGNWLDDDLDELCMIKGTSINESVIATNYNDNNGCTGFISSFSEELVVRNMNFNAVRLV